MEEKEFFESLKMNSHIMDDDLNKWYKFKYEKNKLRGLEWLNEESIEIDKE